MAELLTISMAKGQGLEGIAQDTDRVIWNCRDVVVFMNAAEFSFRLKLYGLFGCFLGKWL